MTANVTLVALTAVMYAAGIYLLLDRSLTRVLLGVLVLGNATNLLLLSAGGAAGRAPFTGNGDPSQLSDPLAQAMILTAIVITLGLAAFVLSLIYRNVLLGREAADDELVDDEEDRRIALIAARDAVAGVHGDESDDETSDADSDAAEGEATATVGGVPLAGSEDAP